MASVKELSQILYEVWDPLGVKTWATARDKYDDWSPRKVAMLGARMSVDALPNGLDEMVTSMSLRPG
jgi:hypothetical protein